jgi:hypothetical protein
VKKAEVAVGGTYFARVSGRTVKVRLDREVEPRGWDATNLATGRQIRVKSAARLSCAHVDCGCAGEGRVWSAEEIAARKAKAEAGRGSGIYPAIADLLRGKYAKPQPNGKCHRCGVELKPGKPTAIFCDRYCRGAYYNFPTRAQLKEWGLFDGDCEATDGCVVELDGRCPHGFDSWLKVFKMI